MHIAQSIYRFSSCRHVLGGGKKQCEWMKRFMQKSSWNLRLASPRCVTHLPTYHSHRVSLYLCISYIVMFVLFIVTKWGLGLSEIVEPSLSYVIRLSGAADAAAPLRQIDVLFVWFGSDKIPVGVVDLLGIALLGLWNCFWISYSIEIADFILLNKLIQFKLFKLLYRYMVLDVIEEFFFKELLY